MRAGVCQGGVLSVAGWPVDWLGPSGEPLVFCLVTRVTLSLIHIFGDSGGDDSLLLRIFAAAPRDHAQRWNRERGFFAAYRWRSEHVLEEQSVPHAALHRGKRFAASAVGDSRSRAKSDGGQHSHRVGESVRGPIRGAVLDGRRSDQGANQGGVAELCAWRSDGRARRK